MTDIYSFPLDPPLPPNTVEVRIATPSGRDILIYGSKDKCTITKRVNDNGSIQFLITGAYDISSNTVPGTMIFTSEDTDPFGRFQRSDGLYREF